MNDILGFINRMDVNYAQLTPSLVNLITPEDVPGLETLLLVGEAMSKSHVEAWAGRLNLINGYGPSECSVSAVINNQMTVDSIPSNIGRRLDRCWIVDAKNHNRLCPIGTVGELLVEGPTLARGYLNNPQKTAEVFIKNPKWAATRSGDRRMYKTGDLVKFSGDGSMDMIFVGRKDTQTKVRGQRLELDEVEHHLNADKAVRNVLVLVPKEGPEAKKLVAVISLHSIPISNTLTSEIDMITSKEATSEASAIRERLRRRLPAFMVPSKWIILRKLPLLPSGKLNRRQITRFVEKLDEYKPPKQAATRTIARPKAKAQKPIEVDPNIDIPEALRKVWSHILKLPIEEVDLDSSFLQLVGTQALLSLDLALTSYFAQGGDSISAMQVMARCRSQGFTVTVQDIIASKSIRELATKVTLPKTATTTPPTATAVKAKVRVEAEPISNVDVPEALRKVWSEILKLPIEEVDLESSFLHLVSNIMPIY
ncbi:hypothetical protein VTO42DRAFT_2899 [Malbranchea cinnamomea]